MNIALSLEEMSLGGGPKFVLNLGRQLTNAGHAVTVVVERKGVWWQQLAEHGLDGYCLPARMGASVAGQAQRLASYWNRRAVDAIIINISGLNKLAQRALHLAADRTAIVPVLHGDWNEIYNLAGRLAPLWNCAVGVSPKVQQTAAARIPNKPVLSIPNGVETPTPAQLRARVDWQHPLRLLFAGRLIDAHKGVLRLPHILAACRARDLPVHLTVVGDGPDRQVLVQRCAELGVSDGVSLLGAQSPAQVETAMRSHHVLLLPSNTEGMPLVVLEAQANGCVVIASDLPGITTLAIEDGVSGRLVQPGDIDGYASHVAALTDAATWRAHSAAALERAQRLFSVTAMGARYGELLDALARGAHPLERPRSALRAAQPMQFGLRERLPTAVARLIPPRVYATLGRIKRRLV